jgi:hypothetical protein
MENYFQPEDDGLLLISEMERNCVRPYMVVCIRRDKGFPLLYLRTTATCESEAVEKISKENPLVKVLRAYVSK